LNILSLFDGISCGHLALERAGIPATQYFASEIDKYAMKVTQENFPDTIQLGDVCNHSSWELPKIDLVMGGSPCFPAGTMVLTLDGYRDIKDIRIGDKVYTHMNRWRLVTDIGNKESETILLKGNVKVETTANHPIYSKPYTVNVSGTRGHQKTTRTLSDRAEWVCAESMQGRLWATPTAFDGLPIPLPKRSESTHNSSKVEFPEMDESFWYFVGRWLGDGWVRNGQRSGRPEG
jgi:hypothetical protein